MRDLVERYGTLRALGVAYTQGLLSTAEARCVEQYMSPEGLLAWHLAALVLQLQRGIGHTSTSRPLPDDSGSERRG